MTTTGPQGDPPWLAGSQGGGLPGLAGDWWRQFAQPIPQQGTAEFEAWRAAIVDGYRRSFGPALAQAAAWPQPAIGDAALLARWQAATMRLSELIGVVAQDAFRRLAGELESTAPDAVPITSLRQLHELWVECGETAWGVAAHRPEFAEAQAEWLAASVAWLAAGRGRRP